MFTYDKEQQAAIDVAMVRVKQLDADPFVTVQHGSLHQRGAETWAIFGQAAYRLHTEDVSEYGALACEFVPVIVDGHAFAMWPDEGRGGVLHLQRLHLNRSGQPMKDPQWFGNYLPCSWLRAEELNLSNEQISDIIAEEVAREVQDGIV